MKKVYWVLCFVLLLAGQGWAHGEKGLKGVKVVSLAKTSESWNGKALPSYPKGKPQITILKITIGPKVRLPLHKHPVINAGVLLKGKLTVITEKGETLHMKAGDPIVEVINTWHYGINEGDKPAVIIVFYAGTPGTPVTILKKTAGTKP